MHQVNRYRAVPTHLTPSLMLTLALTLQPPISSAQDDTTTADPPSDSAPDSSEDSGSSTIIVVLLGLIVIMGLGFAFYVKRLQNM